MKKTCAKSGIKIHYSNNDNITHHNKNDDLSNINLSTLDLNIDNYSYQDLLDLFKISDLSEKTIKLVKKKVLSFHPDKCKLNYDIYLFFSKAYNRLYNIYTSQNNITKSSENNTSYSESYFKDKKILLDKFFSENKNLKSSIEFNNWFNEKFNKHFIKEDDFGYEEWLKSDEGFYKTDKITLSQLNSEIEKHKERVSSIVPHKECQEYSSYDSFSDLKEAYEQSVIPVSQNDYHNTKKFQKLDDYINFRNNCSKNIKPMDAQSSKLYLQKKNKYLEDQFVALSFKNIARTEQNKQQNNLFWANLKLLK